jgi:hypothetical protein
MPTLTIKHVTPYQYRQPVAFGEHWMMLHPLPSHHQSLIAAKLVITPTPAHIRPKQDAFGNHVSIARFAGRARELRFDSTNRLDQTRMPGLKSICLDPVGSILIPPTMASSVIAASFGSRWCAIRARQYRCTGPGQGFRPTTWE